MYQLNGDDDERKNAGKPFASIKGRLQYFNSAINVIIAINYIGTQ